METFKRMCKDVAKGLLIVVLFVIFCEFFWEICGMVIGLSFGGILLSAIFFDKLPRKWQKRMRKYAKVFFDYMEKLWNAFLEDVLPNLFHVFLYIFCFVCIYVTYHESGLLIIPVGGGCAIFILMNVNEE